MGFEFDRSILGREQEVGTYYMDKERLIRFARAAGDENPLYVDEEAAEASEFGGLIAAPMFHSILATTERMPYLDIKYGTMGIAAGHDCEFHRPIRPGDVLTVTCCIEDVYEKTGRSGKMLFVIRRATFTDREGQKVVVVRHSQILK